MSLARSDLAVLAQAIPAWQAADTARIKILNAWVLQTRESSELRAQSEQMGRSLLEWRRNHTTATADQITLPANLQPTYPLAFALAAASTQPPLRDCLLAEVIAFIETRGMLNSHNY